MCVWVGVGVGGWVSVKGMFAEGMCKSGVFYPVSYRIAGNIGDL